MALLCSLLEEGKLEVEIVDYTLCVCVFVTQGSTHSEMALLFSLLEEEKVEIVDYTLCVCVCVCVYNTGVNPQ